MAKITKINKSRTVQKCSKCGKLIDVGSSYLKATPYRARPIIRCVQCGLKQYETSQSSYTQEVGRIVEDWEEVYGIDDSTLETIIEDLGIIMDDCQDSLNNMPEQLQESSPLQERIETLESVINDLSDLNSLQDYITDNEDEEAGKEEFRDAINDCLYCLDY